MESRCIHCDDLLPDAGDCARCATGARAPELLPAFLGRDLQLDRRRREETLRATPPPAIAPLPVPPSLRARQSPSRLRALTLEALAPPLPVQLPAHPVPVGRKAIDRDAAFLRDALLGGEAPSSEPEAPSPSGCDLPGDARADGASAVLAGAGRSSECDLPDDARTVAVPKAQGGEAFARDALPSPVSGGQGASASAGPQTLRMFPDASPSQEARVAEATEARGLGALAEKLRLETLVEALGMGGLTPASETPGIPELAPDTEGATQAQPAELWRRALAWAVDGALVLAVGAFYLGLAHWVTGGVGIQGLLLPAFALYVLVGAVYATVGSLMGGRTLGLRIAGIRLVDGQGRAPAPTVTLARALLGAVSAAPLGLGFWLALVDRRGQTLHDKLTSTFIVQSL